MVRSLSIVLILLLLGGCVSLTPRFTATNFNRDSRTCERQTHQIAGETEYQRCMARLGWPDSQTQSSRIQANDSAQDRRLNLLDETVNGLQFGIQWDLSPK